MSVDRQQVSNWWFTLNSIQRSFLLSLLIHLIVALSIWMGAFPVAEKMMASVIPDLIDFEALEQQQRKRQRSVIFLEVPPNMASENAPEDSKYYSNQNSEAADEQTEKETPQPKIDGTQEKVPRIVDSKMTPPTKPTEPKSEPKPKPPKPEPAPSKAETLNPIQTKPKPEPKPEPKPRRPRTVAEAKQLAMVQGQKIKQEGGVKKRATIVGLDAKASPFGDYDARLIAAIQNRWNQILDLHYTPSVGRVVLTFNLWSDGKVTNVQIERSTVNTILALKCERAVKEPSPYEPWPEKMRDEIDSDRRFVRFTFYYN